MTTTPPWRTIVAELLDELASKEEQLEYERNVPHVNITAELVELWFSDTYHPDSESFINCFSKDELAALAQFNSVFAEMRRELPDSQGTVQTWLAAPSWREVMRKASLTRDALST